MPKLLDDLSGYDFEELMVDVFRNLGYENPRVHKQGADEGRDIVMEEVIDGQRRAVIVECKHRQSVSRPVVQKLHSAVTTYDYDGPKRGIVATTGRFTKPAQEYAEKVGANSTEPAIELIDGTDLRRIGDQVGLDLYNGRIEVLCDKTLRPYDPIAGLDKPLREAFSPVENLPVGNLSASHRGVEFLPMLDIVTTVEATFETSVGEIHRIDDTSRFIIRADKQGPSMPAQPYQELVSTHIREAMQFNESTFDSEFNTIDINRFERTETEYNEWIVDRVRDAHTTTVHYTGNNNVDYSKECRPKQSDVQIQSITPVYLPKVSQVLSLGEYDHKYEYAAAGAARETATSPVRCVHCAEDTTKHTYTHCTNCGSINCPTHTKTERVEGEPICTGCAVTESFMWSTKYFYDESNRETFKAEYEAMPIHRKFGENPALAAGLVVTAFSIAIGMGLFII
ncbi:restriction endonuclease [Halogranum rubrum]|uniref:Restriction endonuclease n=1 Tax=Halogranum salarium B-1 TaxID=1210908 RepID=J3JDT6_9EURY|nr:restriction endonuclease [Halogranum salarium]EJN57771.1 restriction endonuclease [Halogranum salarium B-1]